MYKIDLGITTYNDNYFRYGGSDIYALNRDVNSGKHIPENVQTLIRQFTDAIAAVNKFAKLEKYEARGKRLHFYVKAKIKDEEADFDFYAEDYWEYDEGGTMFCCYDDFGDFIISKIVEAFDGFPKFGVAYYIPSVNEGAEYKMYNIWAGRYNNVRSHGYVPFDKIIKLEISNNRNIIKIFFEKYNKYRKEFEPVNPADPYVLENISEHPRGFIEYGEGNVYSYELVEFMLKTPIRVQLISNPAYIMKYMNRENARIKHWKRKFDVRDIDESTIKKFMFPMEDPVTKIKKILEEKGEITTDEIKELGVEPFRVIPKLKKEVGEIKKEKADKRRYKYILDR